MNYAKKFVFNHDLKHILSVISYRLKKQVKPFPSIIHIQTINWCNASCKMCPNSQNKNRFVEIMPDDLFEKIVLEIEREAKSYTMVLLYLQNEPLTDDFFLKRMQFFKNHKNKHMSIGFLTNGSLLNDNIISKLKQVEVDFISVSLDAYTPKTYKLIRNGLDFDTVIGNIDKLLSSEFDSRRLAVEFVFQSKNINEFDDFKNFWKKKTGTIMINYLTDRSGDLKKYDELRLFEKNFGIKTRLKFKMVKKLMNFCPKPFIAFHIVSNGDVILCIEDYSRKIILGNIWESSIKEVWNSEKYKKIREKISRKQYEQISPCNSCSIWKEGKFHWF